MPPNVEEPVYACRYPIYSYPVVVSGTIAGAFVEVFRRHNESAPWRLLASAFGTQDQTTVYPTVLEVDEQVVARQTICRTRTVLGEGQSATVTSPPPKRPFVTYPQKNMIVPTERPRFTWQDLAAGSPIEANYYDVAVTAPQESPTKLIPVGITYWVFERNLPPERGLVFWIRALNKDGKSSEWQQIPFSIHVPAPPSKPPAKPVLNSYDTTTLVLTGEGFTANHTVHANLLISGTIQNPYDRTLIPDNRVGHWQGNSNHEGRISFKVDPKSALPPLRLDYYGNYWFGAASGETMYITANEETSTQTNTIAVLC